jgi:hypothetical protein
MVTSMLKAAVAAAAVFALAWIRMPHLASSLTSAVRIFFGYGVLIVILSLMIGVPLAYVIERCRIGRWWSYMSIAALIGAVLAGTPAYRGASDDPVTVANPFALSFSPWNRDAPGFTGNIPISQADFVGSVAFGAGVGAVLGLAFWYFYLRGTRPNSRWRGP